jgi:hypothetical protein
MATMVVSELVFLFTLSLGVTGETGLSSRDIAKDLHVRHIDLSTLVVRLV